ncbi:MAG: glycosyltransferase [Pseudomonadota bacterium]
MDEQPGNHTRLSVSIVLHNNALAMFSRVLESLYQASRVAHEQGHVGSVSVQVLDNSSSFDFREQAAEVVQVAPGDTFFRVHYRALPDNRGFGAGHNVAIDELDSDYHLVLNPDAELDEHALRLGLGSLQEDQSIVLVSPRVSGDDGAQEFLCKRYPSLFVLMLRPFAPRIIRRIFRRALYRYEMRDVCSGSEEAEVLLASGCFMLVRSSALQSVGGFNDRYFLYFEDFDLSIRLGGEGRLVFNPAINIVHHGGHAARKGLRHVKYFVRSGFTFFQEHGWRLL